MSRSDEPGGGAVSTGPAGACSADAAGSGGMSAPWPDTLEARVARLLGEGESVVLVTVISRTGSAPRDAGTRALYTQAGPEGTVGGGLLEARAMEAAAQSLFMGRSARVSCDLSGFTPDSDMICGGGMEVLCEVLLPEQAGLFSLAALALSEGVGGVWVVDVSHETPSRSLCLDSLPQGGELAAGASLDTAAARELAARRKGRAGLVEKGESSVYVEPLAAPTILLLCGGGHVSLEVARLAHACGFVVDVADDRPEFSNPQRFPMARRCYVLPEYENLVNACGIGRHHYVAIITRGHGFDRETLAQALTSHAQYIGMIGSRTKRDQIYALLRAQGVPAAELAAVCCPIGLTIEAETPQQIAVSIVAELLAAQAGTLKRLRFEE
ncbi:MULTISPECIES: XdhC family protein [Desulfovibrio]|uniref:Xanthine dehydrogenase accessory factor n=3 Tax=Desulfovibrio TaxID=872 RepID=A0AA94HS50_DESDE|nr:MULTISPECIES: XdhC/CoxI family protein [Desulfovibrio]MDY0204698.1 XdhC family protein [Desulfovibrio desulfuricans]SFW29822.1 xanthine dehydrogenase accessory factor [Desulfovibrio desulfuricans]SPD35041.1 XdhC and CoxI family [Desulfovibrio sp. G11]